MGNKIWFFIVLLVGFVSCQSSYTPEEYLNWMEDEAHGLIQKKKIADLEVQAFYKTDIYNMLKELGPENIKDTSLINQYMASTGELQFYEISLSKDTSDFIENQSRDVSDYHKQLYYFTFGFQQDIALICSEQDTLKPVLYHFERAYSLSNTKKIIVAFPLSDDCGDRVVQIDSPLLPTGIVNLFFSKADIETALQKELKY